MELKSSLSIAVLFVLIMSCGMSPVFLTKEFHCHGDAKTLVLSISKLNVSVASSF